MYLAIRRNIGDFAKMRRDVLAGLLHLTQVKADCNEDDENDGKVFCVAA